jgi:hypothetical protein
VRVTQALSTNKRPLLAYSVEKAVAEASIVVAILAMRVS